MRSSWIFVGGRMLCKIRASKVWASQLNMLYINTTVDKGALKALQKERFWHLLLVLSANQNMPTLIRT
jgi:hypothetical protein